ncbi:hypothetical protein BJ138DRAFT_1152420 [Hygrophoropsis aurantiaca]|uniref:Uncharacterized protein n=1 Tax=Hygrophoropsis aurantiaca TaxID=72124 RepID=A0ACB8ABI0_9AGAM|nr:hypothetical protein BJ138DRAFT_1152420 [Hygrophoropsis aurantiaca]
MAESPLASFNPFAAHPFTNGSGIVPPHPVEAPADTSRYNFQSSVAPTMFPESDLSQKSPVVQSRKPQRYKLQAPGHTEPIFVPFRPEKASPDLSEILVSESSTTISVKINDLWKR